MKTVFITGDRSMPPLEAAHLVDLILKKTILEAHDDLAIGTGNLSQGVERAVRYIVPDQLLNIINYTHDDEGNIVFDEAFKLLEPSCDEVIFLHVDPLSSHIGKALARVFPPEKIHMPMQEIPAEL